MFQDPERRCFWVRQRRHGTSTGSVLLHPLRTCEKPSSRPYPDACGTLLIDRNSFQGFDSGIYTIIISEQAFIDEFSITSSKSGVVASMVNLGNVIGNLFISWWFIWYLGRRYTFSLGTVVLLVGVALQAGATNFAMIVVGRIISGIGTAT